MRQNFNLRSRTGRNAGGSILLLVVGLLTVVAMLGGAFLLVARFDQRQSTATADKAIADSIASAAVSRVQRALGEDICPPGSHARYENLPSGQSGWLQYIDTAGELNGIASSLTPPGAGGMFHTGQFNSNGDEFVYIITLADTSGKVNINTAWTSTPTTASPVSFLETPFWPTHVGLDRLVDANNANKIVVQRTNGTSADFYHSYAIPRLMYPLTGTYTGGLFSAAEALPFGLGDESYFLLDGVPAPRRYTGNGINVSSARQFLTAHNSSPAVLRQSGSIKPQDMLQPTFMMPAQQATAGSTSLVLSAITDRRQAWDPNSLAGYSVAIVGGTNVGLMSRTIVSNMKDTLIVSPAFSASPDANSVYRIYAGPQKIYDRTKDMLDRLGVAGNHDKMAAAFAANLWAYQDYYDPNGALTCNAGDAACNPSDNLWAFKPNGSSTTYYGTVAGLVITEAYAKYTPADSTIPGSVAKWFAAVEIWNPTQRTMGADEYKLQATDGSSVSLGFSFGKFGTATDRHVFYDYGGYADATEAMTDNPGITNGSRLEGQIVPPATSAPPVIKFCKDTPQGTEPVVKLMRGQVPVDEVSAADIGHSVSLTDATAKVDDGMRDDNSNRQRFNVAVYTTAKPKTLGTPNNLAATDLPGYPVPIPMSPARSSAENTFIKSIGELERIFLTCSTKDANNNTKPFTRAIKDDFADDAPGRGRLDLRGDWDAGAASYKVNDPAGYDASKYPPVPAACFLPEFLNMLMPDMTRTDNPFRVYGRINVNTAPVQVLACLPFVQAYPTFKLADDSNVVMPAPNPTDAAKIIDAYRNCSKVTIGAASFDYTCNPNDPVGTGRDKGAGISNLRQIPDTNNAGKFVDDLSRVILTPGEIAIPLSDYSNDLLANALGAPNWGSLDPAKKLLLMRSPEYVNARDYLYNQVANLVSVNSDTYSVVITVALYDSNRSKVKTLHPNDAYNPATNPLVPMWRYAAVVDRSNVMRAIKEGWKLNTEYSVNDIVEDARGVCYICTAPGNLNQAPPTNAPSNAYWKQVEHPEPPMLLMFSSLN